jgi:hypothetical protein
MSTPTMGEPVVSFCKEIYTLRVLASGTGVERESEFEIERVEE